MHAKKTQILIIVFLALSAISYVAKGWESQNREFLNSVIKKVKQEVMGPKVDTKTIYDKFDRYFEEPTSYHKLYLSHELYSSTAIQWACLVGMSELLEKNLLSDEIPEKRREREEAFGQKITKLKNEKEKLLPLMKKYLNFVEGHWASRTAKLIAEYCKEPSYNRKICEKKEDKKKIDEFYAKKIEKFWGCAYELFKEVHEFYPDEKYSIVYMAEALFYKGPRTEEVLGKIRTLLEQYDEKVPSAPATESDPKEREDHGGKVFYRKGKAGNTLSVRLKKSLDSRSDDAGRIMEDSPRPLVGAGASVGGSGDSGSDVDDSDSDDARRSRPSQKRLVKPEEDGFFNEDGDNYEEPKDLMDVVRCNEESFDRLETATTHFSCSFYSLGLSRLQAANLLLRNIHDPLVRQYIGEQIFTVLLAGDNNQLPTNKTPYEPIQKLLHQKQELQTRQDNDYRKAFDMIEDAGIARPASLADALLLEDLAEEIKEELQKLQDSEVETQEKEKECRDACSGEDIVKDYILHFVAQPYKTMEFQHDNNGHLTHGVLDAIAYIQEHSLKIYQRFQGSHIILRHSFVHPTADMPTKYIFHSGGAKGGVGHFEKLVKRDGALPDSDDESPGSHHQDAMEKDDAMGEDLAAGGSDDASDDEGHKSAEDGTKRGGKSGRELSFQLKKERNAEIIRLFKTLEEERERRGEKQGTKSRLFEEIRASMSDAKYGNITPKIVKNIISPLLDSKEMSLQEKKERKAYILELATQAPQLSAEQIFERLKKEWRAIKMQTIRNIIKEARSQVDEEPREVAKKNNQEKKRVEILNLWKKYKEDQKVSGKKTIRKKFLEVFIEPMNVGVEPKNALFISKKWVTELLTENPRPSLGHSVAWEKNPLTQHESAHLSDEKKRELSIKLVKEGYFSAEVSQHIFSLHQSKGPKVIDGWVKAHEEREEKKERKREEKEAVMDAWNEYKRSQKDRQPTVSNFFQTHLREPREGKGSWNPKAWIPADSPLFSISFKRVKEILESQLKPMKKRTTTGDGESRGGKRPKPDGE